MNREEAAKKWEWVVENFNESAIYSCPDERQKLIESISLLRNPIPDPATGLVPCGCGGVPLLEDWEWVDDKNMWECWCPKCRIKTGFYTNVDAARSVWNRAMGYKGGAE